MTVEIRVPNLGESVTEAGVAKWFKREGQYVERDEPIVELETDKAAVEVNAAQAGVIEKILVEAGATVKVGTLLATITEAKGEAAKPARPQIDVPQPAPAAPHVAAEPQAARATAPEPVAMPAAAKLIAESRLAAEAITGTGKGGRITKGDVLAFIERVPAPQPAPEPTPAPAPMPGAAPAVRAPAAREERVRMSRLRRVIASRLKDAQNTAAMLTTFNEVDMSALGAARKAYAEAFEKRHGVRLGIMSFFVKAGVAALKTYPVVNAEIEGEEIVYKNYYNIGIAVSTPQGLIVPVLKDADRLGFGDIERAIADFSRRGREGKIGVEELRGGTFTITNGGVFGSLLSTPILNPPQSGILGMHKIQDRPVALEGKIEIRPMMYLALSYDHRLVDGREAVSFLIAVKAAIEDPQRLLLDL
jgi:2-oxoglutarate dehydrogenase E2 component (dihydrolipoamide succinyltransferase)